MDSAHEFVRAHTAVGAAPYVPEVRLHIAADAFALWERTERERGGGGAAPPFWAFPWAGGQALARHVLDRPEVVAGRGVLDLAAGSGLVAIAAARAGARTVTASEIDPYAVAAVGLNARLNGVTVRAELADVLDGATDADVVLAGDVFYSREMAERVLAFLDRAAARGALVLVGDPGRAYLPRQRLSCVSQHAVPVIRELEDADVKQVTVWELARSQHLAQAGQPAQSRR
jgi:predicted nicotinamide N-methyase